MCILMNGPHLEPLTLGNMVQFFASKNNLNSGIVYNKSGLSVDFFLPPCYTFPGVQFYFGLEVSYFCLLWVFYPLCFHPFGLVFLLYHFWLVSETK